MPDCVKENRPRPSIVEFFRHSESYVTISVVLLALLAGNQYMEDHAEAVVRKLATLPNCGLIGNENTVTINGQFQDLTYVGAGCEILIGQWELVGASVGFTEDYNTKQVYAPLKIQSVAAFNHRLYPPEPKLINP
jgi:hypothetical protein